ncbi:unnamed protein product [Calypogeia fissa]
MEGATTPPSGGVSNAAGTTATAASTANPASSSVIQRLTKFGVAVDNLGKGPAGLVEFMNQDPAQLPAVLDALFPGVEEVKEVSSAEEGQTGASREEFFNLCEEAVSWVQWLLFSADPKTSLGETGLLNGGQRGICGAVWGSNDIAYRCRTCEHDPTCAICVPCFQAGDHRNHDYLMIRTGGGCCDCGDATAWKQKGFCSRHRGPGFAPSLPTKFLTSGAPVLEALLRLWVSKLNAAQVVAEGKPKKWTLMTSEEKVASQTSIAIIDMLLVFCNSSESMLNFTAKYVGMKNLGVLDTLLRTEYFLPERVVRRLHVLLYKLLGDTSFKCSFAQEFIAHYPKFLRDSVREDLEGPGSTSNTKHGDHAILGNFSVQIFTVPTLTPRLVLESKLLDMLLDTLKELFQACVGEDGRLLVTKGPIVRRVYARVLEDIRYVMSHLEVAQYVAQHRPELAKAWLELGAFVQGMYPQRRVFNIHVEEENEDWESAYCLEMQMALIHPLYVIGAAFGMAGDRVEGKSSHDLSTLESFPDDDASIIRHAKLGRITKETDGMDVGSSSGMDIEMDDVTNASCAGGKESQNTEINAGGKNREGRGVVASMVPVQLVWLVSECINILDKWLALDTARELARGPGQSTSDNCASPGHRRSIWRGRARGPTRGLRTNALILDPVGPVPAPAPTPTPAPTPAPAAGAGAEAGGPGRGGTIREWLRRTRRQYAVEPTGPDERRATGGSASGTDSADMDVDTTTVVESGRSRETTGREWWMGADVHTPGAVAGQLSGEEWPTMDFDVSRQDVSFHIPLHRMVAILLHKALESHASIAELSSRGLDKSMSLRQLLPEKYQGPGFAALMMEHPVRLQVLCAQVQAGMWRRNGHTTSTLCELYRTVPWCEDSLELDLLILQCCSVLAPPEKFVDRIQTRFGLTEYFTLHLRSPNEYEPSLAQEFIVLLIRLCAERGFCGLSQVESLRRELVQRLAVGDATHSSLIKALPRRLQDSKHLDECLNSVAVYRNPSGMQQGKYALREECWRELDLYHPRWSLRELQSAEERYIRSCKASPIFMQLPTWKKPFGPLQTMGRFLTTARVHDILRSVFFHAAFGENLCESRAPEGLLFAALHLLALALDVCSLSVKRGHDGSGDIQMSGQEASGCNVLHAEDTNFSVSGDSSTSGSLGSEEPPLLARSIQRVSVQGADVNLMPESHSLLSLLVLLCRKYGSSGGPAGSLPETIRLTAGDVIKSLLRKFADLHRGCMYEIESLVPEILHRRTVALPTPEGSGGVEPDEQKAVTDAERRKAVARERQQAVMAKMKAAQDRFVASLEVVPSDPEIDATKTRKTAETAEVGEGSSEESTGTACALCRDSGSGSPLCFLTLVQKSRILALAQKPTPSWERPSSKAGLPFSERRSEASGSLVDGTNVEMYTTADLWNWIQEALADAATRERLLEGEALLEVFRNGIHPGIRNAVRLANAVGLPPVTVTEPVEPEVEEGESSGENNEIESCQEEAPITSPTWWEQDPALTSSEEWSSREVGLATVLAEYVAAVSRDRQRIGDRVQTTRVDIELGQEGSGAVRARRLPGRNIMDATVHTGLGISDTAGVYLSACGHAVHQECLDRYFSTLLQRYYSRALFEGVQIVDPDMGEFLCPVCRRLANSIIPVLPGILGSGLQSKVSSSGSSVVGALPAGNSSGPSELDSSKLRKLQVPQAVCLLSNAENMVSKAGFRKAVNTQLPDSIKGALETLAVRLHGLFNPDKEHGAANGRISQSLHLWDVFRYSLMSAELAARTQQAYSGVQGSLSGLLILEEVVDASKGSVFPLLLQAAQAVQGQSRQVVLLRSRGMQLLADSVLHGVSRDLFSEKSIQGNFSSLLQYLEKSQDSADVQFWKCMADPVLLHDPFSSLLWLLFCLPLPLPSGEGPFTALVHLYYSVCLTQVISYAGATLQSDAEVGPSAFTFVTGVQETLSGTVLSPGSDSDYPSIPTGPPLTVFRRLTLPYLRQCSLLQRLISGAGQVLPIPSAHLWELSQRTGLTSVQTSNRNADGGVRQEEQQLLGEMAELDQLESLFSIPPLTALLNDNDFQSIAQKWCHHVRGEGGARSLRYIPRPVRAAPFKLMELPHLFQDLLQRCVKMKMYVKERCLRCGTVPEKPALCLLCGTLCCAVASMRPCCSVNRQGECYRHAMACGAGVGVFLMLRKTNILLQRCERQAFWPSPYLDAFGEEDVEQRGKPLFLSEERYAALNAMVASHGLDYCSLVLAHTTRQML